VGQVVQGTVTNTVDFGAFVDVGQGVEGLVHISEMPAGHSTLREIEPGAEIHVRVLEIDSDRRRISLSLRNVDYTIGLAMAAPDREKLAALQENDVPAE
jgi:small subunit ribosomal protein S1